MNISILKDDFKSFLNCVETYSNSRESRYMLIDDQRITDWNLAFGGTESQFFPKNDTTRKGWIVRHSYQNTPAIKGKIDNHVVCFDLENFKVFIENLSQEISDNVKIVRDFDKETKIGTVLLESGVFRYELKGTISQKCYFISNN